jgi:hypothetical protein
MTETEEMITQIEGVFDGEFNIDFDSADKAEEEKMEHVRRWLGYGALRSLVYTTSDGLKGVFDHEELGPWFHERTNAIKVLFDPDLDRVWSCKWEDKTLFIMYAHEWIVQTNNVTQTIQPMTHADPLFIAVK